MLFTLDILLDNRPAFKEKRMTPHASASIALAVIVIATAHNGS
jgi:hypothetical protein